MFYYYPVSEDITIPFKLSLETLPDLKKGIECMNQNLHKSVKLNMSEIARLLNVDRRTASRHYHEGPPSKKRNRKHQAEQYEAILSELLLPSGRDAPKCFSYIRHLFHYMKDNYGMQISESAFRRYIHSVPEFAAYFHKTKTVAEKNVTVRYETPPGDLAQLDWKESIPMIVKDPDFPLLYVNVMVLKMAYSRKTFVHMSVQKTQDILFSALTEVFECMGGVPRRIMTDNMKTVMDIPRTLHDPGKINAKFLEFSKDFGFEVVPCVTRTPQTKGKVESYMKILDEIRAYSGELTYQELVKKVNMIGQRYNMTPNQVTGRIPNVLFKEQEKGLLLPLPRRQIRDHYKVLKGKAIVNRSSLVHYKNNQYSVPPEYVGKVVTLSVFDESLYLYHNTELIAIHRISLQKHKMIFLPSHEKSIWKTVFPNMTEERISEISKNNLRQLGDVFRHDK